MTPCKTCGSTGFAPSSIADQCEFCDGTAAGNGPGLDLDSDEPLVCNPNRPAGETCESCQ